MDEGEIKVISELGRAPAQTQRAPVCTDRLEIGCKSPGADFAKPQYMVNKSQYFKAALTVVNNNVLVR